MTAPSWRPQLVTEEEPRSGLRIIPPDRLMREPAEREWMVERCFLKGTVALVSGDGGIGKSLLLQQLLSCAAMGRPWLGLNVTPGRSIYLACEDDDDELHRRQIAICKSMGVDVVDVIEGGLYLAGQVGQDNVLARLNRQGNWRLEPTRLFGELTQFALDVGATYIVADPVAQLFDAPKNDERWVTQFGIIARRIAMMIQGVLIMTQHPSLSGRSSGTGESGSTAWNNTVSRSRLYLRERTDATGRPDGSGIVDLHGVKSNYGPKLEKLPLRWENGVFVVDQIEQERVERANKPLSDIERSDLRYRLLVYLKRLVQHGNDVYADERHDAGLIRRAQRMDPSVPPAELIKAHHAMLEAGQTVLVRVGHRKMLRAADGPRYEGEAIV